MSFSDDALAQRLKNLATDCHLSGDAVGAKWLYEAAARILELSDIVNTWHPSLGARTEATAFESYGETVVFKVKNPWEDLP
jgi:hypothetical protein